MNIPLRMRHEAQNLPRLVGQTSHRTGALVGVDRICPALAMFIDIPKRDVPALVELFEGGFVFHDDSPFGVGDRKVHQPIIIDE